MTTHRTCDGIGRRDFLKIGALTGAGLSLPEYLRLVEAGETNPAARGKAAIFVRLAGGPSHLDTFDMKAEAPATHRGSFSEISTSVPGVRICEHLPKLAACADKYAILRGVSHTLGAHRLGSVYLNTGNRPLPSLTFPTYGAVVSKELGGRRDLPTHVAIPQALENPTGFLGVEYGPFSTGEAPRPGRKLNVRGITLRSGVTLADIERRHDMLRRYDKTFEGLETSNALIGGLDKFSERAFAMLRSKTTRAAFDTTRESKSIVDLFGEQPFSQSCLLATRLVEAGVRFVTMSYGGWDTHRENFPKLQGELLPGLDHGLSGLFQALEMKGLLESTTVFVTGEFGRTPKINENGGRDHYPRAMFCLLAGGGIGGGRVIGKSDALGAGPDSDGITPDDVAASFYHSLGIDVTKEYKTPSGRPVMIVRNGRPIHDLFG